MPAIEGDDAHSSSPRGSDVFFEDAYRALADLLREIAEKKFHVPFADAESIVSEVFIAFLLREPQVRDTKKWLIGAVCHASRAYWRKAARTQPLPPDIAQHPDPDTQEIEDKIINNITIAVALSRLNPKCRETLRMYYFEGYSAAEIAEKIGTTTGYVMQLLHACRKRAREIYKCLGKESR
ncbi:MAG TPA: sigma-70 family RNA polymerase sigma factor [Thermoanaerobaculia bacterium]|nr:sigma-70 family RNA polymerase sigma factor [Thermoanaerobaculia bacterium]